MAPNREMVMDFSNDHRNSVEELAEEFAERFRRGEKPSIAEYTGLYPQWAEEIRDLFPALAMLESLKPSDASDDYGRIAESRRRPMERLGDYRIVREIGRGGMGIVYEAVQESLGRYVALKVLAPHSLLTPMFQERFRREAKAAAKLHHTNIVPVFGVGESDGFHYYAMQFIRGESFDKVLHDLRRLRKTDSTRERNPWPIAEGLEGSAAGCLLDGRFEASAPEAGETRRTAASDTSVIPITAVESAPSSGLVSSSTGVDYFRRVARIGLQIADALAYAHRQGVIHRDIKPSNLLLDVQGVVWITDFGLAKAADADDLTNTGDIVGTIRYMAPERFAGNSDARADIYALGVTLYEMLTLSPAFDGKDKLRLVSQITKVSPTPPCKIDPTIPRDLETIVLKSIAHDPAKRYQSAAELAEDLQRFLVDRPVKARRASATELLLRWCRRNPAVAALLGAVVLLLVFVVIGSSVAAALWKKERDEAVKARKESTDANVAMKEELWRSLRDRANAGILSKRYGRRFESLRVIREAVKVGRELEISPSSSLELRNLAIAALALPDVQKTRKWNGWPEGTVLMAADANLERYARANKAGLVSLRNIADDSPIATLGGFPGDFWLLVSPDGRFVAQRQGKSSLCVWSVNEGSPHVLPFHDNFTYMCFTPDNRLLYLKEDSSVWIRELDSGSSPCKIVSIPGIRGLRADPRGKRFACLVERGIQVRDLQTGSLISQIADRHLVPVGECMVWHPTVDILAFADVDKRVRIWDVQADRELAVLEGITNAGITMSFVAGGEMLATSSWEERIRLWDWHTGKQSLILPGHHFDASFQSDRLLVLNRTQGVVAELWQIDPAREYRTISIAATSQDELLLWDAAIHPSGRILTLATSQGAMLFDLTNGRKLATLSESPRSLKSDPTGSILANSSNGLFRYALKFEPGFPSHLTIGLREALNLPGTTGVCDISRDGSLIAVAVGSGAAYTVGKNKPTTVSHPDCRRLSISCDKQWLATGSHNLPSARIWRLDNPKEPKVLLPECGAMDVQFSPGGKWLATTGGGLRLWHVGTWEPGPFVGNSNGFAFNADDSLLAVESGGGRIRLLEPATGRELACLEDPNQDEATWLGFTPDGTRLIASSAIGKAIHIWDLRRIRTGLSEMGLDWDARPYPPATEEKEEPTPLEVHDRSRDAIAAWSVAIALQPYNPEAYFQRAIAWNEKELSEANADLTKAIELLPGQVRFHKQRAAVGHLLDNAEQLLVDYGQLLKLNPEDGSSCNNLAWIYVAGPLKYRDANKALPLAEKCARLQPKDGNALNTLGVTLFRLGRYREALEMLEKSLPMNSAYSGCDLYFLSMCHQRLGETAKARAYFDRAVKWQTSARLSAALVQELTSFKAEAESLLGIEVPRN